MSRVAVNFIPGAVSLLSFETQPIRAVFSIRNTRFREYGVVKTVTEMRIELT